MKTKPRITILFMLCILTLSCSSDDDNANGSDPVNQLPEATQTGENTFGCLLDGEAFIPGGGNNSLDCVYQLINGERFFHLQGNKRDADFNLLSINLVTRAKEIEYGETYELMEEAMGNVTGVYGFSGNFSFTSAQHSGELTITHLDMINQIVSGTFWFDVIDQNGELTQVENFRLKSLKKHPIFIHF